jgi:hypothetical protein
MKKLIRFIKNPLQLIISLGFRGYFFWIPDALWLKIVFRIKMGYKLDLNNPKTFNEKLQWLKLHDRNPLYTTLVDKYEVRKYIAETIGEEYLIPLLGVWDHFEDIDFNKLPNQFVLKCTHDSGGLIICKDKSKLDIKAAKKKINSCLKRNYYWAFREWPYKNVKPRIIAEKYMEDSPKKGLPDYKFFCFDGEIDCVMVCIDRHIHDTKFYFFDKNWTLLLYNLRGKNAPENFTLPKPQNIQQMFELVIQLSKNTSFVRIDLYEVKNQIYFGEITFYPDSGFDPNILEETDLLWGNKILIKDIK